MLTKLFQETLIKILHMSGWCFLWRPKALQRVEAQPLINPEVSYLDMMATVSRLNTLYGFKTLYAQSSRQ